MQISKIYGWRSLTTLAIVGCCFSSAASAATAANPCDVAREYVRLIEAKQYDAVGDLWAEDAVFYSPLGVVINGRDNIRNFYSTMMRKLVPTNRISTLTHDANTNVCVMELETRAVRDAAGEWKTDTAGDFQRTAVDLFTINAHGKIQQMRVYLAPPRRWVQ